MATLVERLGEPPKQRYRLFEEYYRTIYTRETNREGPLSDLLRDRKTDIDTIHYRTGLLLQAESELAGKTAAQLTLRRFLDLVRQRLTEQGLDGSESEILIDEIKTSALDRLIFLVSPHDEEVGFEIRSLQEFMAAEAMARGTTEHRRLRIEEIAPITNWRNVFLFLFGKLCDEDSVELLDKITLLCDELNDLELNPEHASVKWGSRLALDILSDGATRPAPKRERKLLRTALELLDQSFLTGSHEFSSVYHEKLEDLYRAKIDPILETDFHKNKSLAAWGVLNSLANRGVEWARASYQELWQKLPNHRAKYAVCGDLSIFNAWHLPRAIELIPQLTPWEAFSLAQSEGEAADVNVMELWPRWLFGFNHIAIRHFAYDSGDDLTGIAVSFECDGQLAIGSIEHRLLGMPLDVDAAIAFLDMPSPGDQWDTIFAAIRFALSPTRETLASALRVIGAPNKHKFHWRRNWISAIAPWPLISLMDGRFDTAIANSLAALAENGHFGDFEDWNEAERLAQREVVSYSLNGPGPVHGYDKDSLSRGLPLAGSTGLETDREKTDLQFWGNLIEKQRGSANEALVLRWFASRLSRFIAQNAEHNIEIAKLPTATVLSYIQCLKAQSAAVDSSTLNVLLARLSQPDAIAEILDEICLGAGLSCLPHGQQTSLGDTIREAVIRERLSERAIQWANWCTRNGILIGLSQAHLEMSPAAGILTPYQTALLRLGATDLTESECRCILEGLAHSQYSATTSSHVEALSAAIERLTSGARDAVRKVALSSFVEDSDLGENEGLDGVYSYSLYEALDERRSALQTSPEKWAELGFLPAPKD